MKHNGNRSARDAAARGAVASTFRRNWEREVVMAEKSRRGGRNGTILLAPPYARRILDGANMSPRRLTISISLIVSAVLVPYLVFAQAGPPPRAGEPQGAPKPPAVEQLGPNLYRVGQIRVDLARREISVPGTVNPDVKTLEFIANGRDGLRAYETAVTLDTDGVTFNTALLLIGLDRSRSRNAPKSHFDPTVAEGDPVDVSIACPGRECQRMPAERLMYDTGTKRALSGGSWVYTGSSFLPDGRYLAQIDGTLVSFVHDPASIIEYASGAGLNRYGSIVLNPNLNLPAKTPVTVTIRSLRQTAAP